jgi:hypothetical protein
LTTLALVVIHLGRVDTVGCSAYDGALYSGSCLGTLDSPPILSDQSHSELSSVFHLLPMPISRLEMPRCPTSSIHPIGSVA